jgi:dolichyl-phosphate beta-glucosyltransferase
MEDGSHDLTSDVIPPHPKIKIFRFDTNRGKGAALKEGFLQSKGDVVFFTDADLPYGTDLFLPSIYAIHSQHYAAVIGDRALALSTFPKKIGIVRKTLSTLCSLFVRTLLVGGVSDTQCGFKAFRGDVIRKVAPLLKVERFAIDIEILYLLLKYQFAIKHLPVHQSTKTPSTVKIFQDSWIAFKDILRLKWRWMTGQYQSKELLEISKEEQKEMLRA